jgi:division protein CdvB (Snf7/Vps24/ESCRT-III family)
MEEKAIITHDLYSLSDFASKFEKMFLEMTKRKKEIPEKFMENYLELIGEINKVKTILKRVNDEPKNIPRASKRL